MIKGLDVDVKRILIGWGDRGRGGRINIWSKRIVTPPPTHSPSQREAR